MSHVQQHAKSANEIDNTTKSRLRASATSANSARACRPSRGRTAPRLVTAQSPGEGDVDFAAAFMEAPGAPEGRLPKAPGSLEES